MTTAHDFDFIGIDGKKIKMKDYAGKAVLVVNVASFCGFTPQYSELQKLHEIYGAKGLVVLGVPSNDFGAQEPKTEAEIRKFCETSFGVTFPMTAKETIVGLDAHELYKWFSGEAGEAVAPKWNFHKYLIDKHGKLVGSWPSKVKPTSPEITRAVETALAA
jgi:glutathione peroxidase